MKWEKKEIAPEQVKDIAAQYGCDMLTASVLARRGLVSGDSIRYFLEDDLRHLRNPFEMPGIEESVERILVAKEEGEKVLVFGDSDVDGITGTALLAGYLAEIGMDVQWRIPAGDEAYGLSAKVVEEFAATDGTLIITVDCGISCNAEIRRANELSVDVIVTDHHEPPDDLPEAFAIINPKLKNNPYPFRDLAGCSVAFKLVSALRFVQKSEPYDYSADLQLAALGTLADIMPLLDENRIIVRKGIESLRANPRPGLAELLCKLDLAGSRFSAKDISWKLCPAINAARRMGSPEKAVALFFEKDSAIRDKLADELIVLNNRRKILEEKVWKFAEPMADKSLAEYDEKFVLVYGEEINKGITGLIAQRMTRRFNVPAMAVSFNGENCTGWLRSARDCNVCSILEQCGDLFLDSGGNQNAFGFTMNRENWDKLTERLKNLAPAIEFSEADTEETISVDAEISPANLSPDIFKLVDRFEPYGRGNNPLTFMTKNLTVKEISFIGKDKHLKMMIGAGKHKLPALYWQAANRVTNKEFGIEDRVDVVFNLERNWFKDIATPQMVITDLRLANAKK